jgi:hypothetical protein
MPKPMRIGVLNLDGTRVNSLKRHALYFDRLSFDRTYLEMIALIRLEVLISDGVGFTDAVAKLTSAIPCSFKSGSLEIRSAPGNIGT